MALRQGDIETAAEAAMTLDRQIREAAQQNFNSDQTQLEDAVLANTTAPTMAAGLLKQLEEAEKIYEDRIDQDTRARDRLNEQLADARLTLRAVRDAKHTLTTTNVVPEQALTKDPAVSEEIIDWDKVTKPTKRGEVVATYKE